MANRITYKTLEQLFEDSAQVIVQQILNKRIHHKELGWIDIKVSMELRTKVIDNTVEILGGHSKTKLKVNWGLSNNNIQHWGLERILLSSYKGVAKLKYCAGQSYTEEIATIRSYIKEH